MTGVELDTKSVSAIECINRGWTEQVDDQISIVITESSTHSVARTINARTIQPGGGQPLADILAVCTVSWQAGGPVLKQ